MQRLCLPQRLKPVRAEDGAGQDCQRSTPTCSPAARLSSSGSPRPPATRSACRRPRRDLLVEDQLFELAFAVAQKTDANNRTLARFFSHSAKRVGGCASIVPSAGRARRA